MSLYSKWNDLMNGQTEETFEKFWDEYSSTEKKIYEDILTNHKTTLSGKYSELLEKYQADPIIFMGFMDGINSSLTEANDLENITEDSEVKFKIDFKKLFFNMLKADADYLYSLPQWNDIYTEEELVAIVKEYKRSKIVHKEKEPGRNDPCPCGSGKKYKKCCGKK